jgi:phasin
MEFAKANSTAHLDFTQELLGVKSPTDAFQLWTGHAKTQLETFQAQAKELAEIAQRAASATAEPIKASASKFYPAA